MTDPALEFFMAHFVAPTPQSECKGRRVVVDGGPLDLDTLSLVIAWAWRTYVHAPSVAAVSSLWAAASKQAALLVRSEDVAVPRSTITQYVLAPMEPMLTATETAAITSWGINAVDVSDIKVLAPKLGSHIKVPIVPSDVQDTLAASGAVASIATARATARGGMAPSATAHACRGMLIPGRLIRDECRCARRAEGWMSEGWGCRAS